jgi:hypothetical protein
VDTAAFTMWSGHWERAIAARHQQVVLQLVPPPQHNGCPGKSKSIRALPPGSRITGFLKILQASNGT